MNEVVRAFAAVIGFVVFMWVILPTTLYMCSKFIRRGWYEAEVEHQQRKI